MEVTLVCTGNATGVYCSVGSSGKLLAAVCLFVCYVHFAGQWVSHLPVYDIDYKVISNYIVIIIKCWQIANEERRRQKTIGLTILLFLFVRLVLLLN